MKYESSILNGLKVMTKVKFFVYAAKSDADADGRGYDISSPEIRPGSLIINISLTLIKTFKHCILCFEFTVRY